MKQAFECKNLKTIANVDDECIGFWHHCNPRPVLAHLQTTNFALVQDCEQIGVGMRP